MFLKSTHRPTHYVVFVFLVFASHVSVSAQQGFVPVPENQRLIKLRPSYGGLPFDKFFNNTLHRVRIDDILNIQMGRTTSAQNSEFVKWAFPPYIPNLTRDQMHRLADAWGAYAEANELFRDEYYKKEDEARDRGDNEAEMEYRKVALDGQADMEQFICDFGYEIAEVLTPEQLEALKAMAYTTSLQHLGGDLSKLFELSMKEHGVDVSGLEKDEAFEKKMYALKNRYENRLRALNKEMMDEFLDLLPKEPRQAMEFTLGVDTLVHPRPDKKSGK